MSRTMHRPAKIQRDGYSIQRDPRPAPRRRRTARDVIRAELAEATQGTRKADAR